MVLEQHLFDRNNALLDYDALKNAHVLELGYENHLEVDTFN